jgi:hypothetical protein
MGEEPTVVTGALGRGARWLAGAAVLAMMPGQAFAETAREKALAARLEQLEAAVQGLRTELDAARAQQATTQARAQAAADQVRATETRLAAVEAKPAPAPAVVPDGFKSGATTIRIGGFLKTVASFSRFDDGALAGSSLGRDFYLPQQIPTGGAANRYQDFAAKQTRLWLNLSTDVAGHTAKGYVETDFQVATGTQGSERTTNGYDLGLRRAYVQFDDWLVGQDWSTFQYVGALPESADYIGVTEGTVFVRQPLVRYTKTLSPGTLLMVSAESPESATGSPGAATLVENDTDKLPDAAIRLQHAAAFGELSLAGMVRELSVTNATFRDKTVGWGASAAGKIPFGEGKRSDIRFMATYGQGLGRYVGLNFAPDAITDPAAGKLRAVKIFAAFAALHCGVTPAVRVNLMGAYQKVDYPGALSAVSFATFNDSAWSVAGNLFWAPIKGIDVGAEYRHGERELVSGTKGQLDRLEFFGKYSF